ncbi:MAG: GAF domain-containing protein [Anaerolineae bacterium]|nr:GAF domain-containing protein [Anaerolineae bacterium]
MPDRATAAVNNNQAGEEADRQQAAQLRLIADISQRVLSILDPEALLDYAVKAIQTEFSYYYVDVFLTNPQTGYVVFRSSSHPEKMLHWQEKGLRFRIGEEGIIGHVAATGRPYLSNDVLHDPFYIPDELLPHTRSELVVPIRAGERVLGVLDLNSEQPNAFDEQDLFVTQSLADQLALGLENARLFAAEARRRREAEKLQTATQALSATLDLNQVLESILEELQDVVPYDSASVQQLRDGSLEIIGGHGFANSEQLLGMRFDLVAGDNPNREVMLKRAPVIIDDAPTIYQGFQSEPHVQTPIRSWLGVPLLFGDRLIGMIALDKREPSFYTQEHARLAMAFAAQAAIAIENARLFSAERQSRLELRSLQDTVAALSAELHLDTLLERIVNEAARAFQAEAVSLMLWDKTSSNMVVSAGFGLTADYAQQQRIPRERLTAMIPPDGRPRPIYTEDLAETPYGDRELIVREGLRSALSVPLYQTQLSGILNIYSKGRIRTFSPAQIDLAETFAAQATVAIKNARLYQAEREQRALAEAMRQATAAISSSLDLDQVLDDILEQLNNVIPGDAVSVMLIDGEYARMVRTRGYERLGTASSFSSFALRITNTSTFRVMQQTGAPLLIPNTADYPGWVQMPETPWLGSYAGAPIYVGGQVIGFLNADSSTPDFFTQADCDRLQAFAAQAAVAIQNAQLYQELSHHLEEVQLLNKAALAASSTLDFDEVIRRTLAALLKMPCFERANVLLLDSDTGELWLHPALAHSDHFPQRADFRIPPGMGISGRVVQTGKPWRVDDVRQVPTYVAGYPDTLSEIAVPLRAGDRFIGVLDAQSTRLNAFTEEDERLLVTLGGQLSTVIDNARLYGEARQRVRELTALSQVSQALNEARDLKAVLDIVLEEAFELMGSQEGSIILISPPGGNRLRMVAERSLGSEVVDAFNNRPVYTHEGTYRRALATGQIVEVPDTSADPDFLQDVGSRAKSITNVPLITEHRAIGLIAVDGLPKDDATRRLLMALADMAAAAIDKERLHQETTDRLAEVSTLYTLSTQITGSLSLSRVMESIVTILKVTINCRACCIFLVDPATSTLRLEASSGLPQEQHASARLSPDRGIGGRVFNERRSIYIPDARLVADLDYFDTEVSSLLAVPLIVRNQVIGLLALDDTRTGAFAGEIRLLTIVAAQAAVAIENAQLYESLQASYHDLEDAYSALRELDRMKSELVQNISHELRTPLTFVRGYLELLQEGDMGELSQQQKQALDIVADKASLLSRLVDDIITLQYAREQVQFHSVPLADVGRNALRAAQASADQARIALRDEIAADLPLILGDEQRLGQVFDNLLSNALKFSHPGGAVTVRIYEEAGSIRAEVEDQGVGIPADKLTRVFDRFYQIDGSTTRRFGGTGLGLAIAKQIVEAHGGQIGVRSKQDEGSCFYFTIPKAPPPGAQP